MVKSKFEKAENFKNQNYEKIKKQLIQRKVLFSDLAFPATAASLGINNSDTTVDWKRPKVVIFAPKKCPLKISNLHVIN